MAAERDPRSVILTESLPDCADIMCITVLRNAEHTVSDYWLRPYVHKSIVPIGLQTASPSPNHTKKITNALETRMVIVYDSSFHFSSHFNKLVRSFNPFV